MWLNTNFGFFSIVRKPEDMAAGSVTVRSRLRGDLETLRKRYLHQMGPIVANAGTDYKYRARVSQSDFADPVRTLPHRILRVRKKWG